MTVTSEQLGEESDGVVRQQTPPTTPNVVVVTEHEVMLGSAISISTPARSGRRLHRFVRVLRRVVTWSPDATERDRPQRRAYPHRTPDWYSDALLAREMRRL
jgi:hypothetical protein